MAGKNRTHTPPAASTCRAPIASNSPPWVWALPKNRWPPEKNAASLSAPMPPMTLSTPRTRRTTAAKRTHAWSFWAGARGGSGAGAAPMPYGRSSPVVLMGSIRSWPDAALNGARTRRRHRRAPLVRVRARRHPDQARDELEHARVEGVVALRRPPSPQDPRPGGSRAEDPPERPGHRPGAPRSREGGPDHLRPGELLLRPRGGADAGGRERLQVLPARGIEPVVVAAEHRGHGGGDRARVVRERLA